MARNVNALFVTFTLNQFIFFTALLYVHVSVCVYIYTDAREYVYIVSIVNISRICEFYRYLEISNLLLSFMKIFVDVICYFYR